MSQAGGGGLKKLTLKKTPSQAQVSQQANGVQPFGSGPAPRPAPVAAQATPPSATAAEGARPAAAPGTAPRRFGLTLKGAKSSSTPQAAASTPTGSRISLKGAGSSSHAAATPQQVHQAVPATPASAPSTGPRRLALKGQSSRPPASAAGTPAPAAAAATPGTAPRTAPPTVAGGFATPRPAAAASTPARAASTTPGHAAPSSTKPKGLGIRLKGSSSTPAAAGLPRQPSATPGGNSNAAGAGSGPMKPRITLNKSRGRQNSMGLSQQQSMQSQHSLQPSIGHPPMQPVAYKQEAYKQQEQQQQQYGQQYYGSQGYDSSSHAAAGGYGGSYAHDPAAAAAGSSMYGMASTDPAAAAAGGMYGSSVGHDAGAYGGYDAAAAAATAVVDYSAHSYYQPPQQQKGQKRSRPAPISKPVAASAVVEPLGPRTKRPKPGQFRDTEEEDADEDFNPKAERTRAMRGAGGSGGVATARVKSKGPSGARAAAAAAPAWPSPAAARPGSNRAAAAQKAAHRAAQNAAQRMHPHAHVGPHMSHVGGGPPQRAGGGHMSAVVPAHRPRQPIMPVGSGALAPAGAPRSPVLGEDMGSVLPSGADLAAAFAQSTAAQDLGAAVGIDFETGGSDAAAAAAAVAPAERPAPKPARGGGRGRQGAHHQRRSVDAVLQELHSQVEHVEETHPPTRENLIKLLAAVDKRDKYRFFVKPVTIEQAPGYFDIIKNPMDLSVMKSKVEGGSYGSWNELMSDIILMCANAKVFNHPNTKPHKEADVIFKYSMKYVKSFKQGKTALRGAVAMAVRNATMAADAAAGAVGGGAAGGDKAGADAKGAATSGPMTRNARRGGRRPREEDGDGAPTKTKRGRQPKFIPLSQNVDFSLGSSLDGDSARETYKGRVRMYVHVWGGLADGASPEGLPFAGCGKPILRCATGAHISTLAPDTYLKSLTRFVSGAGAAVEKLVLQLMGRDLSSKLIPIPGVSLPQQQQQQPGAHPAAHRAPHQQVQQHHQVPGGQLPAHAGMGMGAVPVGAHGMQQPGQQQSLAGIFGGVPGLTPAQLQQLQQNQLQQQLRQQQQRQQQGSQQFVPGPGAGHIGMGMAHAPGTMAGRPS